jgi:hypothetical protein
VTTKQQLCAERRKQKYSAVPLPSVDGFASAPDLSGGICVAAAAALAQSVRKSVQQRRGDEHLSAAINISRLFPPRLTAFRAVGCYILYYM